MTRPDLTVIIPVYNALRDGGVMLRACLDSVLSQGVAMEVIVVDDGSSDGTGAFVRSNYADQRMQLLQQPENKGLSAARNVGIDMARGRYISFVDSDDLLLRDALAAMLAAADDCNAQIVVGGITRTGGHGVPPWCCKRTEKLKDRIACCSTARRRGHRDAVACEVSIYPSVDYVQRTLYQRGGHNSACAVLIGRELMLRNKFREGWYYEDLLLMPRLYLQVDSVAVIDRTVYYYRDNPSSFINSWSEKRLDALRVCEDNLQYMARHCPEAVAAARDRLMSAAFNIYRLARKNNRPAVCDRCVQIIKTHRLASLKNPRVRPKNRIAALLSYLTFI